MSESSVLKMSVVLLGSAVIERLSGFAGGVFCETGVIDQSNVKGPVPVVSTRNCWVREQLSALVPFESGLMVIVSSLGAWHCVRTPRVKVSSEVFPDEGSTTTQYVPPPVVSCAWKLMNGVPAWHTNELLDTATGVVKSSESR